ncbi:DUF2971 domain-containing protein [Rhizobium sp. MHM7A]|nr:DUF2971 domain-containing protein [Rhizobium sp. MHM7A]
MKLSFDDLTADILKPEKYEGAPSVLYHYCSNESFFRIIESRSIRLSALNCSNDSSEGQWYWDLLAQEFQSRGLDIHTKLPGLYERLFGRGPTLGFCLSEAADRLSQWRGYADDGRGFCIGFSGAALQSFRRRFVKVEYSREKQDAMIKEIASRQIDGGRELTDGIDEYSGNLLYAMKNPGFEEEQEWRLLSSKPAEDCDYFSRGNILVPYETLKMTGEDLGVFVKKVIIGPNNKTPAAFVQAFLHKYDFTRSQVSVEPSKSTYINR